MNLLMFIPLVLISLTVHEFAHGFAANLCGDRTAKDMGRVTLNPITHIDPFGLLVMVVGYIGTSSYSRFPLLIGWAKPVPVNPAQYRNPKRDEVIVSLAGVSANILFSVVVALSYRAISHVMLIGDEITSIAQMLIKINCSLAVFNLIPIPPLDGSHVLMNYMRPDKAIKYQMFFTPLVSIIILMAIINISYLRIILIYPYALLATLVSRIM